MTSVMPSYTWKITRSVENNPRKEIFESLGRFLPVFQANSQKGKQDQFYFGSPWKPYLSVNPQVSLFSFMVILAKLRESKEALDEVRKLLI